MTVRNVADRLIEIPIVTSFTKLGYLARRQLAEWDDPANTDLAGHLIAITGPTSGLGAQAARELASMNASLILIARSESKLSELVAELDVLGSGQMYPYVCDLGDHDRVRAVGAEVASNHPIIDALVHNAGSLFNVRRENSAGMELTVAVQVVAPHILTTVLLGSLQAAPDGQVVTMSSGGMYAARLSVSGLQMPPNKYNGSQQYALAKRAQVTLNEMWATRPEAEGVRFQAMHPGWADTPGVEESLPAFGKVLGPLLRTPHEGVDTLVWLLSTDDATAAASGTFWLDRKVRAIHKLPTTSRSDTPERRRALWDWVAEAARAE
jgi:dehydrogenase/reductase SDR family member 12